MITPKTVDTNALDLEALRQRIASHADPVGSLIDVANGLPLRFLDIDGDGNAVERLEHVSVSQRLTVLRELKDALLPKLSRNDPQIAEKRQNASWDDLIERRASQN
jgi:hypothetical protein